MSSKSRQGRSSGNERRNQRSHPQTANHLPTSRRLWKPALIAVLAVAILLLGFAAKCWRPLNDKSADPTPSSSDRAPSGRPVHRHGAANEAFNNQVNHGNELLAQGKPAEAVQILTEAAQMNPQDEDVHYDLGLALARLGKIDQAMQQYSEALRIFPDYVEAHNNLGNLLMRARRTDEAIQHFETAIRIMPEYAAAHNNLGTVLQRTGRTNEALLQFQQAVKINPDYWEAHFNVGTSCLELGRLDEARSELETVRRLKPDFQAAQTALAEVEARKASAGP
jgi:tetratricopeptide (TPR) repeat protein